VAHGPSISTSVAEETKACLFSPVLTDWLLDWSFMGANMPTQQSNVKWTSGLGPVDRKGRATTMMFDQIAGALGVAALFNLPLVLLGIAALRFGTDSRPTVGDRDQRPWLVPSR